MTKLKKWLIGVSLGLVGVITITGVTAYAMWNKEISTVFSLKMLVDEKLEENKAGPLYELNVKGDYYFDKFLEKGGAKNDQELIDHIVGNITKGIIPISIKAPTIGCSSFTARLEDGTRYFGRNYDFSTTSSMIVHTNPGKGRYKSVSSVDLQFLGIKNGAKLDSLMQKVLTLATPYIPLDGINEKGVACGIYMTYQGATDTRSATPTDQNTDKPDLTSTTMLRMILDYADSVETAVKLVEKYDLHDSASTSFHYMVADSTGTSAILEWVGKDSKNDTDGSKRELNVIYNFNDDVIGEKEAQDKFQYVTNFIVTNDYYSSDSEKAGLDRYNEIQKMINEDGSNPSGIMDSEEDMVNILRRVGRRNWDKINGKTDSNSITVHSTLYNLTEKSVYYVNNEEFDNPSACFRYSL